MYQSIGINLSKNLDSATKKIKVPAITQRSYYKDSDNCEEEYINLYKSNCDDNNTDNNYDNNYDYLDDDYNESIDSDSECTCGCCDLFMDKMKNIDSKVVIMAGVGALIGFIGLYKLLKIR